MATRRQIQIIERAARRYRITPATLWGVWGAETNFGRNKNNSSAGAQGDFQFMPATARAYGINPHNFGQSALAAAKYLSTYRKRGLKGALAAYNAGPAGNPNNPETRAYVPKVIALRKTWPGGKGGGGGASRGSGSSTSVSFPAPKLGGTQIADLLRTELGQSAPSLPPLGDIPAPAHSAQNLVPMPKGPVLQPVATAAPTVDVDGLAEQLRGIEGLRGPKLQQLSVTTTGGGGGSGGGLSATGKVRIAPGADRPGVRTSGNVTHFLRRVAAFTGEPVTVTTGTRHNRLTVNGNVSDHWSGNAADIAVPVDSKKGDRIAGAALVAAGVPRARARQMVRRGGLWTLNHNGYRIQVIWRTMAGGNHHNHVHVGIRRA